MNRQFYAVKETIRVDDKDDRTIRLLMAKKILPDNKAVLVAIGYEGGGQWSDFYATYQLDEYNESVLETIETFGGFPDEDSEYLSDYENLNDYINKFVDLDEEMVPSFKKEYLEDSEFDQETGELTHEWDWDDEVHIAASDEWQIMYVFSRDPIDF
jgi:hypothetical protein